MKKKYSAGAEALLQMFEQHPDKWISFYAQKDINLSLKPYNVSSLQKYFVCYETRTGKLKLLTKDEGVNKQIDIDVRQVENWFFQTDLVKKIMTLKQQVENNKVKEETDTGFMPDPPERLHKNDELDWIKNSPYSKVDKDESENNDE